MCVNKSIGNLVLVYKDTLFSISSNKKKMSFSRLGCRKQQKKRKSTTMQSMDRQMLVKNCATA